MEHPTAESWEQRGVEEVGCKIYSGAPKVIQTTGLVKVGKVKKPTSSLYSATIQAY